MEIELLDTSAIVYLKNKDIDRKKWDTCINDAANGLVYALSFYLDKMAKHWDALVMKDYETVMPITWNKKYGFYYLYQPFLCASGGVFGKTITPRIVSAFLDKIPRRFSYWDIYLNAANNFPLEKYDTHKRTNYVLNINKPYPALLDKYRYSYRQIIKKIAANNLVVKSNINLDEIISLAKIKLEPLAKIMAQDWQNFVQLYDTMAARSSAINYGVYLKDELLASGVFLFSNNRAYYVLAGNQSNGRARGASHLVIDTFIKDHANTGLILDFEGSNVAGIAFFFKGFGAIPEEYPAIKYNALPPVLRLLKR